ncbi:DUF3168 domain-containing protein [Hyphomonas sp.]|uniref:DUF3168 domain-containing protein n=1 Tax=Hyphomonas sp. TaxID=87 RepID=UPI0035276323
MQAALMTLLRADAGVKAVFGVPARVLDAESEEPLYPYALIDRHESSPAGASLVDGLEHRITLACYTRDYGVRGAKECLSALRAAVEGAVWAVEGQHIVLSQVIFADAMRTPDKRAFRGVVRIRIISEEAA